MKDYRRFYRQKSIGPLIILFSLFILPLALTIRSGLWEEGSFTVKRIVSALIDPYTQRILLFTLKQALYSTLASLVIGLPGAYILATYSFRGKKLIRALATIPFVLPSILVVLGFVIFFGNTGTLNTILMKVFDLDDPPVKILYSFAAIILAHAFYNFPIVMSIVATAWEGLDTKLEAAAATLGSSPRKVLRTITLPRLFPSIISAAVLVFLFCFNSFAIILVLGGGPRFTTLEVEIYRQARMMGDPSGASALAIVSLLINGILFFGYALGQRKLTVAEPMVERAFEERRPTPIRTFFILLYSLFTILFLLGPILAVLSRSFIGSASRAGEATFSITWYRQLLGLERPPGHMSSALAALINSTLIGVAVSILTVTLALLLSVSIVRRNKSSSALELFGMLPMMTSSVIIGLGYVLIARLFRPSLFGTYLLITLAHTVIAFPFALRTILPGVRSLPEAYLHASYTLGFSPGKTFRTIEIPLLRRTLLTAAIFSFALSLGEFNATLILSGSQVVTLPVVMYRLIGSYHFQGACALGSILIITSGLAFFLGEVAKGDSV
ncbi:MAG: iron ABC transporter permease [Spirochaetales bacterium]|nr:iron ABC transporter permease [Spirochaetales bacterium]